MGRNHGVVFQGIAKRAQLHPQGSGCKYPLVCALMNISMRLLLHFELEPEGFKMPMRLANGEKLPVASGASKTLLLKMLTEQEDAWLELFCSAAEVLDHLCATKISVDERGNYRLDLFSFIVDETIAEVENTMRLVHDVESMKGGLRPPHKHP